MIDREAGQIVQALAACPAPRAIDSDLQCGLCHEYLNNHAATCPWRMARDWVTQQAARQPSTVDPSTPPPRGLVSMSVPPPRPVDPGASPTDAPADYDG